MLATLPLEKMTIQDKISTMESIWDDLCRNAADMASPEWHKGVLEQRENNIKSNLDGFIDWEDAKKEIREAIK